MSQLQRNILANFIGKGWTALLTLALVPVYIKLIGIEAYGLIGFFVVLQSVASLLDVGLGTSVNRELARLSAEPGKAQEMRDLVRSLEVVYWLLAVVIALIAIPLAPFISGYWFKPQHLSTDAVRQSVLLMGWAIAAQFAHPLYLGGLLGLQRQVLLNVLEIILVTVRGIGAILVLRLISPSIQAFWWWQICAGLLYTVLTAAFLWRSLPHSDSAPRFQKTQLHSIWRFTAGMTGISILAVLLTNLDKVLLSKLLTLEMFGYYSLATMIASGLYIIVGPIFVAIFPRFSQLVLLRDETELKVLYHRSCQLMAVMLLPVAVVVALFASEIVQLWTGSSLITERTHAIVSLLVIGAALHGLMHIPYALQLAHGWTKLAFYQNMVALALLAPLLLWATSNYGVGGAAMAWATLNTGYVLVSVQVMHTKLLRGEKWQWYIQDVGLPLLSALVIASIGRWFFPRQASMWVTITFLLVVMLLTVMASALATSFIRGLIKTWLFECLDARSATRRMKSQVRVDEIS